uniref:Aminopeptidase N n=1 Tax=Parascaris univalens TaxID=6257 RepID=A0A915A8B6_PARUN
MIVFVRYLVQIFCIASIWSSIDASKTRNRLFDPFVPRTERFAPAPEGKWAFESSTKALTEQDKRVEDVLEAEDYYIRLRPYFPVPGVTLPAGRNMTFDGVTTFRFKVKKSTSTLTFHSFNLQYETITLMDSQGLPLSIASHTINTTLDHLIITPSQPPRVGDTYLLQFVYTGLINHYQSGGLYYTYYVDLDDTMHWMVATHMENGYQARSVFPCLDEPAYKAVFHMTLIYPQGLVALSNEMERESVNLESGWRLTRYPPTPKMSTYLVALAIGPFVSKSVINEAGTLIRIWSWTGQEKHLDFAANHSAKCLYSLGIYLNYSYPMTKSDQIGLPEFRAGAMENFGLIIYKYQYIAFDPSVHSTYVKQAAAGVMCHELAHQWFGNIVTASWWSDLVVNEGFANYFEVHNQAMAVPEQAEFLNAQFLVDMQNALNYDSDLSRSHPVVVTPEERYFDTITYAKGASLFRMIRITLRDEVFQEALQDYIHSYAYLNADHDMLFAKFTAAAQKHNLKDWCGRPLNASDFLDPWFLQQSFPLLTVTNNQLMANAVTTQQPYNNISSLPISNYPFNYSWPVPLFNQDYMNVAPEFRWLKPDYDSCGSAHTKAAESNRALHWDFENSRSSAFARVEYDDIGYARLVDELKANRDIHFTTADKIAILGDEIAFLQRKKNSNQQFSYKRIIELMTIILPNYPHYGTFYLAQSIIDELELLFEDGLDYELFQRFINALLLTNYQSLGWTATDDWDNDIARYLMLPYAVRYNIGDSVAQASNLFSGFVSDCATTTTGVDTCSRIHPDLRRAVYCAGIEHGTADDFQFLMKMYRQQVQHSFYFYQEYYAMLFGLSCTQNQTDMNSLISTMLEAYRPSAAYMPLTYLSRNPIASDIMLAYLRNNLKEILNSSYLREYLDAMTATWQTNARLNQYEKLVASLSSSMTPDQKEVFDVCAKQLQAQVDWSTNYFRDIGHIFYDQLVKKGDQPWSERLPKDLMPLTYDVFVQPYFPSSGAYYWPKNMTFDSTVNITIEVKVATDKVNISVHRLLIQQSDVVIMEDNGRSIGISRIIKDYDNGIMTIYLDQQLSQGTTFSLSIKAVGFIFDVPSEGVYTNVNYFEFNGKMAWILSTDMESGPEVRSLVPCFDEPYFKARWTITIKHAADMIALGNMNDQGSVIDTKEYGWATTSFVQTPLLSSYLIALAVGHFASLEKISKSGVLIRVWGWTGMERYAQEGLDLAAGTVDYMTELLNVSYSLPKLDLVALPQYTGSSGAMENWGLVCMRYTAVLIDPLYAAASEHITVARVTPHEVVHQWFGNLVTTDWWSLIFLNEAFAQYYYVQGAEYTYPEQEKYARFLRFYLADYALIRDGDPSMTRPIISDRKSIFTYAPYYKGSSLLYMLNNVIGMAVMEQGLRSYFQQNAYKTTTDEILWSAITNATEANNVTGWDGQPLNVQTLMDPWMKQATFPVLKIATNGDTVTYSQEPFISDAASLEPSDFDYKWHIPVYSQTPEGSSFRYFIPTVPWTRQLGNSWQVENPSSVGFYRVWYDESTWEPIRVQLNSNFSIFNELTRAQFIADAYALRERGALPWSRVLELVTFISKDVEYAPHFAFERVRNQLLSAFRGTSDMPTIKAFLQQSVDLAYQIHGWSNSTDWAIASLTNLVTENACVAGNADCLSKASILFKEFLINCEHSTTGTGLCNSDVAPDVRRTQYCYGLAQNPEGATLVERMYRWFEENSYYFRRDDDNLLNALACTSDANLRSRLISETLNGSYPVSLLTYISQHDDTNRVIWEYFTSHVEEVVYGVPSFSAFISAATSSWSSAQYLSTIDVFLASGDGQNLSNENRQVLLNAKTTVQSNIDWLSKNRDEIITWINKNLN